MGIFTATSAVVCGALSAAAEFAKVFFDSKRQDMLSGAAALMKEGIIKHLYEKKLGRFITAIYPDGSRNTTVDSSLSFLFMYGPFNTDDDVVVKTMDALNKKLWIATDIGGMARYENDYYYRVSDNVPGNPWFVCSLWLARWYIAVAKTDTELKKGMDILSWVARHSPKSGVLSEQLDPFTGTPVSVQPLIWSHAEFAITVCKYLEKYETITSPGRI